ncbi:unnamed protein product [Dicrocoelium dendriticum]|nr:unnamed protein product [Dicrocoelium dendriticum]
MQTTDISLKPTTKCRLEFFEEAVLNRSHYLARINLLTPVERHATWTPTLEALSLASRLNWRGHSCSIPVQIRPEIATYVPSEVAEQGEDFEFLVAFVKKSFPKNWSEMAYCKEIIKLTSGFIRKCRIRNLQTYHGIADVLVRRTNVSFWEVQHELMFRLNLQMKEVCDFNVEANWAPKEY